jgi:hypothetical protein
MAKRLKKPFRYFMWLLPIAIIAIFIIEYNYVETQYQYNLDNRVIELSVENRVDSSIEKRANSLEKTRFWEGRDYGQELYYYFDQYGFRRDNESDTLIVDGSKEKNIVFIGDSFTEGQFIQNNETFVYKFKQLVKDDYNVYNLGFRGFDSDDEIVILKKYYDIYKPKIVFWQWFLNDYSDYYFENVALENTFQQRRLLFNKSLYNYKKNKVFMTLPDDPEPDFFEDLFLFQKEKNFTLVFIMFPTMKETEKFDYGYYSEQRIEWFNRYYQEFKKQVLDNGYLLIEINESIPEYDYQDERFVVIENDPHPNNYANELVTDVLYNFTKENGII